MRAVSGDCAMSVDIFADRLDRVRRRFVSNIEDKIDAARAAIPDLSEIIPAAATSLGDVYRSVHSIVGIGPTIGFPVIGHAARHVEDVLRAAYCDKRGLTVDETSRLTNSLNALREAASGELRSFHSAEE
jgi:chemotaxis protein histidine kinase CheA